MKKILNIKEYLSVLRNGEEIYKFLEKISETPIEGEFVFNEECYINVFSCRTRNNFDGIFEFHKKYKDIHVLISGEEKIFFCRVQNAETIKSYDEKDDYAFIKANEYSSVTYGRLTGVEFDVGEPHMAGYSAKNRNDILKAVIKVRKA